MDTSNMPIVARLGNSSGKQARFYVTPYLSCRECNGVSFINSFFVQQALTHIKKEAASYYAAKALIDEDAIDDDAVTREKIEEQLFAEWLLQAVASGNEEELPMCPKCGRTNQWVIGANDYSDEIAQDAKEAVKRRKLQVIVATRIAAIVRGKLQRKRFAIDISVKREWDAKVFRSVTRIACMYRRLRAEKVLAVERALSRIKAANPGVVTSIISASRKKVVTAPKALDPAQLVGKSESEIAALQEQHRELEKQAAAEQASRLRLFWYKRKEEVALLFQDYQLLVERTGHDPPRYIVERNLILLGKGIHELETLMATKIQKRLRGTFGRKLSIKFRAEAAYLKRVKCAAVFKIQRVTRGYMTRVTVKVMQRKYFHQSLKQSTKHAKEKQKFDSDCANARRKLLLHYRKERAEEKSARMTGKVGYGAADGNKMKAFLESPYGHHRVVAASMRHVHLQQESNRVRDADFTLQQLKAKELKSICKHLPKFEPYYRSELQRSQEPFLAKVDRYHKFSNSTQVKLRMKQFLKRNEMVQRRSRSER